jgi:small subunit ribosomal protein S20
MANIKSAIKRVKTNEKANAQNSAQKASMRTSVKKAEITIVNNSENVVEVVTAAAKHLDKAASKGLISKNAAARKKSRMAKKVNALQA